MTLCSICHKEPSILEQCHTCRLVFHTDCIPKKSIRDPTNSYLYCYICVRRGWHVSPPALTPPPSPTLTAATAGAPPTTHALAIPSLITNDPPTNPQSQQTQPAAPSRRTRKSRYTTLSDEVESSLAVLYCELESIAPLRSKVEELENKNIKHLQTIRIRDHSLAALRRELEQRQTAQDELDRLRASNRDYEDLRSEVEGLRNRTSVFESELRDAREEAVRARELVETWKSKLAVLLEG